MPYKSTNELSEVIKAGTAWTPWTESVHISEVILKSSNSKKKQEQSCAILLEQEETPKMIVPIL